MAIGLFILAVIIQLAMVLAIFLLSLSRVTGSIVALVTILVTAFISPWSLILGIPIALLCLVLLLTPLRLLSAPLLPKLRGHFAEFLNESSLAHLRMLSSTTCVGLRYGQLYSH